MKEPKDKRTKAYKQWKLKQEKASKGLGDTIAKITKATSIDKVVKFIAGEDCGCDERQEKLNNLFTYFKPKCFTEDEYNYLSALYDKNLSLISYKIQEDLTVIYNRVFNQNKKTDSSCPDCFRRTYKDLKKYFDSYNK